MPAYDSNIEPMFAAKSWLANGACCNRSRLKPRVPSIHVVPLASDKVKVDSNSTSGQPLRFSTLHPFRGFAISDHSPNVVPKNERIVLS